MHPFCPFLLSFLRKRACQREMSHLISFFSKRQEDIKSCSSAVICSGRAKKKSESQSMADTRYLNRTNQRSKKQSVLLHFHFLNKRVVVKYHVWRDKGKINNPKPTGFFCHPSASIWDKSLSLFMCYARTMFRMLKSCQSISL